MRLFQPLRNTVFLALWLSYTLSIAATTLMPTVLTLMILDWRGGIADLGIALSSRTVGFLAGALVGGQIADLFARDRVIAWSSVLRGLSALAIAWLFGENLVALASCLFLSGAGEGAFRSAYQSIMVDVLDEDHLQHANALTTLSARIVQTAGPLIAVALFGLLGAQVALSLSGLFWLSSAGSVLLLRRRLVAPVTGAATAPHAGIWASCHGGLQEAFRHRWFIAGLGALLVWIGIGNSIQQLLLPMVSRQTFGGNSFIGFALSVYAAGAVVGGLLLGNWTPRRPGVVAFLGLSLYGFVPIALFSGSAFLILPAYFLGGLGIELFNIPWFTAIQSRVPRELLGRVSSIDFLVSYGAAPLALAGLPSVITITGQDTALLGAGLAVLAVPILALLTPGAGDLHDPRQLRR